MQLGVRCHQSIHQEVRVEQRQYLSLDQRLSIQNALIENRILLLEVLRGEAYEPRATCPSCGYRLTPAEILRGFRADPTDVTTCCPKCKERFRAELVGRGRYSSVYLKMYCPSQTLSALRGLHVHNPEQLRKINAALVQSALLHFGSLKNAFAKIGVEYLLEGSCDWSDKIVGFLGLLPDTEIARYSGVCLRDVRKLRQARGIARFKRTSLL